MQKAVLTLIGANKNNMENNKKTKRKPVNAIGRGYGGWEKQKVYLYANDGKYLRQYNSRSEFLKDYFPDDIGKRPLFVSERVNDRPSFGYELLPDNTFICKSRLGKEFLRKHEYIVNSIFCNNIKNSKPVECFNLAGEKIAEFLNTRVLENLTKISRHRVYHSCSTNHKKVTKNELLFKYKINKENMKSKTFDTAVVLQDEIAEVNILIDNASATEWEEIEIVFDKGASRIAVCTNAKIVSQVKELILSQNVLLLENLNDAFDKL